MDPARQRGVDDLAMLPARSTHPTRRSAPDTGVSTWPAASARSSTSALPGRVTFAARLAGRGVVVVDHGSTRTTYEPVSASAKVGDVVARGQPIGTLELAGSHCLPLACLHWGWKRGSTYLDPLLLVGGGPIVLLPLWRDLPATTVRAPVPAVRRHRGSVAHASSTPSRTRTETRQRRTRPAGTGVAPAAGDAAAR